MAERSQVEKELEKINAKLARFEESVSRVTAGPRRRRPPGPRPDWMVPFLKALERHGKVLPALREVGRPRSNKTLYLYRASDKWFARAWDDALARYQATRKRAA